MDIIHTTLKNFSFIENINQILPLTKGYEYTKKGVIRTISKPHCDCGHECVRNGWDPLTRAGLVTIKIGRSRCNFCGKEHQKDLSFWEQFISEWEQTLKSFFLRLSDRDLAVRVISDIMDFLIPMGKDSVLRRIFNAIHALVLPSFEGKYQIVHYDEQHPKKGRIQKFRLTLICAITKKVIADKYFDNKDAKTVKSFLETNLDTQKETIIITDDCPWYPNIFEEIFGKKVKHQLCILHLNKLIVADCGKVKTLQEMYNTYLLLDIFFNREKELLFIQTLIEEQKTIPEKEMYEWLKQARKQFNNFVRSLEKMRRREKQNLELRSLERAKDNFKKLKIEKQFLDKPLQKRLKYIEKNWKEFTLFYTTKDCPHTNNVIENYFSSSLKTHRKKQFRTDDGLKNKIKLSTFKRNVGFDKPIKTFFEWGKIFWILNPT